MSAGRRTPPRSGAVAAWSQAESVAPVLYLNPGSAGRRRSRLRRSTSRRTACDCHQQRAQRKAFEVEPDRRDVRAERSPGRTSNPDVRRASNSSLGMRWTCRRFDAFGLRRARYRCRTKGPLCASPSMPWPLLRVMESRDVLLKRCLPSTETATTAPFGAGSCSSGCRISDSGTFAERPIQLDDLEIQDDRERHPK